MKTMIACFVFLAEIDPRLLELENFAVIVGRYKRPWQSIEPFRGALKCSVAIMAGLDRVVYHPLLSTPEAHLIVYEHCLSIITRSDYRRHVTGASARLSAGVSP